MKWATIAGVALLVLLLVARKARAEQWNYAPGYKPGSGYYA